MIFFSKHVFYNSKPSIGELLQHQDSPTVTSLWQTPLFIKGFQSLTSFISHTAGSWQMLHGESMRLWRRRCSPSCLCLWQAICLAAVFPLRLATPVETSPLQLPHPSPLPLPSAAVRLQVTILDTLTSYLVAVEYTLSIGKQQSGVTVRRLTFQPGGSFPRHCKIKHPHCWRKYESLPAHLVPWPSYSMNAGKQRVIVLFRNQERITKNVLNVLKKLL